MLQGKTKCFQQAQLASRCSTRHGCDMKTLVSHTSQSPQRDLDQLVAGIVLELGGANGRSLKLSEKATPAVVIAGIECAIDHLARWNQHYSHDPVTSAFDYARRLDELLARVETELKNPPEILVNFLFGPWPSERTAPMSFHEVEAAIAFEQKQLLEKLARMRAVCQLQRPPPRHDVTKRHCPAVAYQLMQALSHRPITSSPGSPFRTITSLVFEALSGEQGADLKRQCERLLRLVDRYAA
jgi:hypothetical protein